MTTSSSLGKTRITEEDGTISSNEGVNVNDYNNNKSHSATNTCERDDAGVFGLAPQVFVAEVSRLQSQEKHVPQEVACRLAHRVAGGGVAHILPGQHGQSPAVHSYVLGGLGDTEGQTMSAKCHPKNVSDVSHSVAEVS